MVGLGLCPPFGFMDAVRTYVRLRTADSMSLCCVATPISTVTHMHPSAGGHEGPSAVHEHYLEAIVV